MEANLYLYPFGSLFMKILKKNLEDLEFPSVLRQVADYCHTPMGKEAVMKITPMASQEPIELSLRETVEYQSSFENENTIPPHEFDAVNGELQFLNIDNTTLTLEGFKRIVLLVNRVLALQKFFKKYKTYYPLLFEGVNQLNLHPEIPEEVNQVIDRFGEVKNNASQDLSRIRQEILAVRGKINKSFANALNSYASSEYLDDIRESVMDNRRVLAVKAMYRKKVKGRVLGASKTGSIVFMVPDSVSQLNTQLHNLEFEETEEIKRILRKLTEVIRPFSTDLSKYQDYLTAFDVTFAKARYSAAINGMMPGINTDRELNLIEAYHPLLLRTNQLKGLKTYPQTIALHPKNRIVVISGPNAGGKSITLKTVGLLQLMIHSGIPIPVHERSSVCLFQQLLTDIGDNQSIENHLSTYSYRLKNMKGFLQKGDENTLFLIDEFGTGSDPELGGALAEAMLEEFYQKGAYGLITTHYTNLKVLADELPHATNANMLFDSTTLEPTYQLESGQPGSSFTFEVAAKMGIPYRIINKAKKKIARGKVRFDATIAKMQKERNRMAKTGTRLQEEEIKARDEAQKLEKLNAKIKAKLENYQELYDHDQRMIQLGRKLDEAAQRYFQSGKRRPLISELLHLVETENSKRKKSSAKQQQVNKAKKEAVTEEVKREVKALKAGNAKRAKKKPTPPKPMPELKVGDRVRMTDGRAVGSIDSLEKNKAIVNYGQFTTNVSIDKLELVESKS